ncbi:tyrosine-type recombinase/integrase [Herbaspirillum seropedicae]|uniref:site-specific integrase n=1 Tax=Herbaspirillum seropedicae TaxID=964 RepID=UPI003D953E58
MFEVHNSRFASGEILPLLCRTPHQTPAVLPLIYTVLRRRHRAASTLRRDAQIFKWLYQWVYWELGYDFDELVHAGNLHLVIGKIEQFGFWLRTGRVTSKIAGRIGDVQLERRTDWLHPTSFNGYLHTIQMFLTWAAERYLTGATTMPVSEHVLGLKDRIRSNFEALLLGGTSVAQVKGLDNHDLHALLLILHPSSPDNPFRKNARTRNWLIFRLFAEAGPRRGELLKLKTTDIVEKNDKFYVTLRRMPDDPSETRAIPPAQKTLPRTISISEALFLDIEKYIQIERRPIRNGKRSRLSHQFIFTSERGSPLSLSALNSAFSVMRATAFKHSDTPLHPHLLRNTFCNNYFDWRVERTKGELERAADELRYLCGWQPNSKMPQRYAAKWISSQANQQNQARVDIAWDDASYLDPTI